MGKSSTTKQTNDPPEWAKPLLQKGAAAGMDLYDKGVGYNVYGGPTRAQFSPTSLQGMNALLAATGGGQPITNESVFNSPQIQQARQAVAQVAEKNAKAKEGAPAQTGNGVWISQQGMSERRGGRDGGSEPYTYYVNTATGEKSLRPPAGAVMPNSLWGR